MSKERLSIKEYIEKYVDAHSSIRVVRNMTTIFEGTASEIFRQTDVDVDTNKVMITGASEDYLCLSVTLRS